MPRIKRQQIANGVVREVLNHIAKSLDEQRYNLSVTIPNPYGAVEDAIMEYFDAKLDKDFLAAFLWEYDGHNPNNCDCLALDGPDPTCNWCGDYFRVAESLRTELLGYEYAEAPAQ